MISSQFMESSPALTDTILVSPLNNALQIPKFSRTEESYCSKEAHLDSGFVLYVLQDGIILITHEFKNLYFL